MSPKQEFFKYMSICLKGMIYNALDLFVLLGLQWYKVTSHFSWGEVKQFMIESLWKQFSEILVLSEGRQECKPPENYNFYRPFANTKSSILVKIYVKSLVTHCFYILITWIKDRPP